VYQWLLLLLLLLLRQLVTGDDPLSR